MSDMLAEHIASANKMDASIFLGRLVWYSVSGMCVDHKQVIASLHHAAISEATPPIPKDYDVFRRVSTRATVKKVPTANEGEFENYLIREVTGTGENLITRRIVIETVDRKGKRLGYRQAHDIVFNRTSGVITVDAPAIRVEPEDYNNPTIQQIIQNIHGEYAAWRGMLDNYAIREYIRKLLLSWNATCVRDGLYFLPENQAENVFAIEEFVNGLPGGSMLHSMPLVDDKKQREMVRRAFEAETVDSIDSLMGEISEIRATGKKITADRYAAILTQYQNLASSTHGYEELLDTLLVETHSRLELFQRSVLQLQENVKA